MEGKDQKILNDFKMIKDTILPISEEITGENRRAKQKKLDRLKILQGKERAREFANEDDILDIGESEMKHYEEQLDLEAYFKSERSLDVAEETLKHIKRISFLVLIPTILLIIAFFVFNTGETKLPPYRFHPTFKAQRAPKKVMMVTKDNIESIKKFAKNLENSYALKVGTFIGKAANRFYVSENPQMYQSFKPLPKNEQESRLDGKIIFDTLATKKVNYLQEINSPYLVKQIQQDKSINEKTDLKIGSFVVGCPPDETCTKYVLSKEILKNRYTVSPL